MVAEYIDIPNPEQGVLVEVHNPGCPLYAVGGEGGEPWRCRCTCTQVEALLEEFTSLS